MGGQRIDRARPALTSTRAGSPELAHAGALAEAYLKVVVWSCARSFTDAKADRVGRFEMADGGKLFLDEIANVPLNCNQNFCACWNRRV